VNPLASVPTGGSRRRLVVVLGIVSVLVVLLLVAVAEATSPRAEPDTGLTGTSTETSTKPPVSADLPDLNVITIVVDDMNDFTCADADLYLPRSSHWLRDEGRCFENATGTTPVCCPARAELFTGQLPHNNGVERQIDAKEFPAERSIQYQLGQAGLSTFGVGKVFNGVPAEEYVTGEFDTGFDKTDAWSNYGYYGYPVIDENGKSYRPEEQVHTTVRTGDSLRGFISDMADDDTPFFAYAGFFAPHTQSERQGGSRLPEPTPANAHRAVPPFPWHPERDTSDKLLPFRNLDDTRAELAALQAARVRALYDVDDEIATTFELLESTGLLDSTVVLFMSDNGYSLGQNGWEAKAVPYVGSRSIPMLAYHPETFGTGVVDDRQVGLVDIAATLYDLYDLQPNHVLDGHSLAGDYRRSQQYHEFRNERNKFVLQESGFAPFRVPTWRMIVASDGRSYIEYYNSHGRVIWREFYNDPAQQDNLLHPTHQGRRPPASVIHTFRLQLLRAARCAGTTEEGAADPCP
jgi:arylsulfatase A-like enzyme